VPQWLNLTFYEYINFDNLAIQRRMRYAFNV